MRSCSCASCHVGPCQPLAVLRWMCAPILFLLDTVRADANNLTGAGFPQHADETGEVEPLVFAAEANPSYLHRQIIFADRRDMLLSINRIGDSITVVPFQVVHQISSSLPQGSAKSSCRLGLRLWLVCCGLEVECIGQPLLGSEA